MTRLWLVLLCLLAWVPGARADARILALTPAACEMLFAVGAGADVVGVSDYCDHPDAARGLPRVADAQRLYVEQALRLKPTLVVAGQADLAGLSSLRRSGVRVMLVHPTSVPAVLADMRALGRASGHSAVAVRVTGVLRRHLSRIVAKAPRPPVPVFYEVWPEPLLTQGAPSFVTDALARIGARNVFGSVPMETLRTSVEAVMRARPRAIIVPASTPERLAARRAFWRRWLPDVPVVAADPNLLQRPGPRLIDGMAGLQRRLLAAYAAHAHR